MASDRRATPPGSLFDAVRGHAWFVRRFGLARWALYENWRRKSERRFGRKFDPALDGERLLQAMQATDEQIALAKSRGLA